MLLKSIFRNFLDIISENYQFQSNLVQDWETFQQQQQQQQQQSNINPNRPYSEYNPSKSLVESSHSSFTSGPSDARRKASDSDRFVDFNQFLSSLPFPLKNTNNLPSYHTQSIYVKLEPKRALFMGLVLEYFKEIALNLREASGEEESLELKRLTTKFQMTRNKQNLLAKFLGDLKSFTKEIKEKEISDADIYVFLVRTVRADCLLEEVLFEMMKEVVVDFVVTLDESQRKMVVEGDAELNELVLHIRNFGFDSYINGVNNKILNKIKWLSACAFNLSIEFHEIGKDNISSEIFSNCK